MQTPQIFARDLIEEAYRAVLAQGLHITELGRSVFAETWPLLYQLYADLFEGVDAAYFLVHGMVDNSYFLMDLAMIFWLSCGLLQLVRISSQWSAE